MKKEIPFKDIERAKAPHPRDYDVRISISKSGAKGNVVRFGFINRASEAFAIAQYIQMSDVEKLPERIYFKLHNKRTYLDVYKLCSNYKSRTKSLYTVFTPTPGAESVYRELWNGKTFTLNYDSETQLHYIELGGGYGSKQKRGVYNT